MHLSVMIAYHEVALAQTHPVSSKPLRQMLWSRTCGKQHKAKNNKE